jgi:hypothetical protein
MRSFLAHPAMAAATMLVLVAGVAGTLYVRSGDHFAETPAPAPAVASAPARDIVQSSPDPASTEAAPSGSVADDKNAGAPSATSPTGGDVAPGSDAYRVRLDEPDKPDKQDKQGDALAKLKVAKDGLAGPSGGANDTKPMAVDGDRKEQARQEQAPSVQAPAKPAPIMSKLGKKPSGIELRRAEMMPKDLDDENADSVKRDFGRARGADHGASVNEHARASGSAAPAGGGGATAAPGMLAVQPRPVAPPAAAPEPSAIATGSPSTASKGKAPAPAAKPAPRSSLAQAQAPSQAPPQAEPPPPPVTAAPAMAGRDNRRLADKPSPSADAKAEDRSAEDKALLGWAQKRRDQVIAFVRSNNCRAAANTATEIYNRAPGYYAANVATDRSVKPCLAYLNSEREREDRSKASERQERSKAAAKRADVDTPAAAPEPPPARK